MIYCNKCEKEDQKMQVWEKRNIKRRQRTLERKKSGKRATEA